MHLDGKESVEGKTGFFQAPQDTMGSKVLLLSKRREVGRFELGACVLNRFIHVRLFSTLWTVVRQPPRSMRILQARILDAMSFS